MEAATAVLIGELNSTRAQLAQARKRVERLEEEKAALAAAADRAAGAADGRPHAPRDQNTTLEPSRWLVGSR